MYVVILNSAVVQFYADDSFIYTLEVKMSISQNSVLDYLLFYFPLVKNKLEGLRVCLD